MAEAFFQTFKKRPDTLRAILVNVKDVAAVAQQINATSFEVDLTPGYPLITFVRDFGKPKDAITIVVRSGDYIVRGEEGKLTPMTHHELWDNYEDGERI